ncbi:hypothetical protein [Pantoea agglomerans]|uniref:hypothetical protein n=1 Tax=Enterobacter agglomerans TaxID=549 RepID=UPI003C7C4E60
MMAKDWFTHTGVTAEEAERLINQYAKRGVKTRKHLSLDCRTFNVQALLPVTNYEPKPSKAFQSKLWG